MAKKKKHTGHYCKICGEHKANEKFTGKGHATHICKACQKLSASQRKEMQTTFMNTVELVYRDEEEFEEDESMELLFVEEEYTALSACDKDFKSALSEIIEEELTNFILLKGYVPAEKQKRGIIKDVCEIALCEYDVWLKMEQELENFFNHQLSNVTRQLQKDGFPFTSYMDTLTIAETERVVIRKFTRDDLPALHCIMEKPEVMYAWEHGFSKSETRKWLNRQLTRYHKEGYGYFAVLLKETGKLIGQVGLMKSIIHEEEVTELGYIFDDTFWNKGYCTESVKALISYAFEKKKLDRLHCSIRPSNTSSIRIATNMGMEKIGEHAVLYNGMELPHTIYLLKNSNGTT